MFKKIGLGSTSPRTVIGGLVSVVMLALSLPLATAAQAADDYRIKLPHSAELGGTSETGGPDGWIKFRAVYSCAPRVGTVYLIGMVSQGQLRDFEYEEVVTCDGKTHRVTVVTSAYLCVPGGFCSKPPRATITAVFYQPQTWIFGPLVERTVILR